MKTKMRSVSLNAATAVVGFFLITLIAASPTAQGPSANPCAAPANKIVGENCKPGNPRTEWDINADGDVTIQGFATEMSVNLGENVDFKIRTDSPRYRIDIYRMGWYGGNGARLVQTLRPSVPLPQAQPDCIQAPQRLVDCGNWKTSASWRVPADAVSGVYVARLIREDDAPQNWRSEVGPRTGPAGSWELPPPTPHNYGVTGYGKLEDAMKEKRASHIIFVVRDDASRSAVLFQTADPTWVAFNRYGGSSLYGSYYQNAVGAGANADNPRTRAYIVSYNRPLENRQNAVGNQFFNGEYPAVMWLERNGYDVSYFAGVDSDRRGQKIREHRIFASAGHDAYWSAAQRASIEAARAAGVNLAFLGGGTAMWKTRYLTSVDGDNRPDRTLVSYRETLSEGRLDPEPGTWTGTWRDSRAFNPEGAKPENSVTGTIGVVGPSRNDRLEVPAKYSKLRFWRNTEISALPASGLAVMGRGILGEEWDEDIDNGSRPAGLIHLSETTVDNVAYVQDWGSTYDSGTATHVMTLYRAPSGALVFSAGSTQYSWGLGDLHTYFVVPGRLRPDAFGTVKAVQQATVNLFADMGVQPGALQPDLKPAQPSQDRNGPLAKIMSPQEGTAVAGTVTIQGVAADAEGVVAAVEISLDGGATWHPATGTDTWSYAWQTPSDFDHATILVRAVDDSNNTGPVSAPVQIRRSQLLTAR